MTGYATHNPHPPGPAGHRHEGGSSMDTTHRSSRAPALVLALVLALVAALALAQDDMAGEVAPEAFYESSLQTAAYEIYPTEGNSGNGIVQVTENPDGMARAVVTMLGLEQGVMYPAHFHEGDCGSGGGIVYPLEPVPGGKFTNVSEIDGTVFDVINADLYINIHDPNDLSNILACGEVGLGANAQWR